MKKEVKISVILIVLCFLVLQGCSNKTEDVYKEHTGECMLDFECDDNKDYTIDKCEGEPAKCVHHLMSCSEMDGEVCPQDEVCSRQAIDSKEGKCCLFECLKADKCKGVICKDNEECVEGYCVQKSCESLSGYVCEDWKECPVQTLDAIDVLYCCPVPCLDRSKSIYFINSKIGGFVPKDVADRPPKIKFMDDLSNGYEMIYESQDDIIEVDIWIFNESKYINTDLDDHMRSQFNIKDKDFMKQTYDLFKVLGLKDIGAKRAGYMWNSGKYVISISPSYDTVFLDMYLEMYPSDFDTEIVTYD